MDKSIKTNYYSAQNKEINVWKSVGILSDSNTLATCLGWKDTYCKIWAFVNVIFGRGKINFTRFGIL